MDYILVTGAFGGMGKATTKQLLKQGYGVFALDKNIGEPEENLFPIEADITDEQSIKNAFDVIKKKTDKLFAIIHYAGIYLLDSLVEIDSNDFEKIFKINFFGAYLVNKTFLPLLEKGGRIIMTTSELANIDPLPFTGIYAISKSSLDKYAYSLRMELQLLGISVSVIRAGAVKTNMLDVSTSCLDKFCEKTTHFKCNANRFKKIVNSIESKSITTEKLASKTINILRKKNPKFAYSINRNHLLKLFNILPSKLQFFAIRKILK